jgi:pimeloyl-ACP methyl ester carboxylesterase
MSIGQLVDIGSTALHVVERGSGPSVIALHGGPGLDHQAFADYLDPLTERYRLLLVDERGHGRSATSDESTWTLARLAADVGALAHTLGLGRHAVLGHSFGAFVALQHAVDEPNPDVATILSSAVPSAAYFAFVDEALDSFEPAALRSRVIAAMDRQTQVESPDEVREVMSAQMPFMFADPGDPRIAEYEARTAGIVGSPAALRHFVANDYGDINVEGRLDRVEGPMLVLAGRHDRICSIAASEAIARGVPRAEFVILERSGHFAFAEEQEAFLSAVRGFLDAHLGTDT